MSAKTLVSLLFVEGINMDKFVEKMKRYNLVDECGYPLEDYVDYWALLQVAENVVHNFLNDREMDVCDLCGKPIGHLIHVLAN